jgi:hypothetical protein
MRIPPPPTPRRRQPSQRTRITGSTPLHHLQFVLRGKRPPPSPLRNLRIGTLPSSARHPSRIFDPGRSVEEVMRGGEAIGLSSMRERVQLLGGTLRLSSLLGQGTTVKILIPLGRVLR